MTIVGTVCRSQSCQMAKIDLSVDRFLLLTGEEYFRKSKIRKFAQISNCSVARFVRFDIRTVIRTVLQPFLFHFILPCENTNRKKPEQFSLGFIIRVFQLEVCFLSPVPWLPLPFKAQYRARRINIVYIVRRTLSRSHQWIPMTFKRHFFHYWRQFRTIFYCALLDNCTLDFAHCLSLSLSK